MNGTNDSLKESLLAEFSHQTISHMKTEQDSADECTPQLKELERKDKVRRLTEIVEGHAAAENAM